MCQSIWSLNTLPTPPPPQTTDRHSTVVCPGRWGIWTLSGWGGEFELEMSSLSGGIQVFYLNMEVSKGKDFSFPSGVA